MENKFDIAALEHERDELLKVLDCKALDPVSHEYAEIRKAYGDLDTRCREWRKLEAENLRLDYEYKKLTMDNLNAEKKLNNDYEISSKQLCVEERKCESSENVAKFAMFGSVAAALITGATSVINNVMKYRVGSEVIRDTTKEAFGMDSEKVASRVAQDTAKKGFDFFFNR